MMQTSLSAADCSSPRENDDAVDISRAVDVLDRDRTRVRTKSSHCIMAYDELHEILSHMPAKSAIKYSSSLCKWLYNIHSNPRFIRDQSLHSHGHDNGFFLQTMLRRNEPVPKDIAFHLLPSESNSTFGVPQESLDYLPKYGRILSSSNGLLLLGNLSPKGSSEFRVCNPATRKWAPLPLPTPNGFTFKADANYSPLIFVLSQSEFPNDYTIALPVMTEKVFEIADSVSEIAFKPQLLIYCHGKWEEEELCDVAIEGRVLHYDTPVAVFSNATKGLIVHYLSHSFAPDDKTYSEPYIAAFDIRGKRFLRMIKLPEGASEECASEMWIGSYKKLWIFEWNKRSLCLVKWNRSSSSITAWVLDEYGCEGESWRLVMRASERELWPDNVGKWIMSVGVASGKGLLFATAPENVDDDSDDEGSQSVDNDVRSRVFLYSVEGEDKGRLELIGEHCFGWRYPLSMEPDAVTFTPYANTLRPVSVRNVDTFTY